MIKKIFEVKMTNQLNLVSSSLLHQTASLIIIGDLQNTENVDDDDRSDVNNIIVNL
jgi:hypothetical protein